MDSTDPEEYPRKRMEAPSVPGLVRILDNRKPASDVVALPRDGIVLGRGTPSGWFTDDSWVSRKHVRVRRVAGDWVVEDLGSRNGTCVNGEPLGRPATIQGTAVIRMGNSVVLGLDDARCRPVESMKSSDGPILGSAMSRVWEDIGLAAKAADTLLIGGPSGSGKELAAREYHRVSTHGAEQPFVAVNCATIPRELAESLLFGSQRGAYSGAVKDMRGLVQLANGGTLFLDEVAELELPVQAKLLRVLETREVMPLGSARTMPVHLRVCAATHRDLRSAVATDRFREDLYYRLGRPAVVLPGLSKRIDEIPWIVERVLRESGSLHASARLIEQFAIRPFPGNVRELLKELKFAVAGAMAAGETEVTDEFLSPDAGQSLEPSKSASSAKSASSGQVRGSPPSDEEILAALADTDGNVTGAARQLGVHRNHLRRWLAKHPEHVGASPGARPKAGAATPPTETLEQ